MPALEVISHLLTFLVLGYQQDQAVFRFIVKNYKLAIARVFFIVDHTEELSLFEPGQVSRSIIFIFVLLFLRRIGRRWIRWCPGALAGVRRCGGESVPTEWVGMAPFHKRTSSVCGDSAAYLLTHVWSSYKPLSSRMYVLYCIKEQISFQMQFNKRACVVTSSQKFTQSQARSQERSRGHNIGLFGTLHLMLVHWGTGHHGGSSNWSE